MIHTTTTSCSYILSTGSVFVTSYSGFSIMFNCNTISKNIIQIDAYNAAYYPTTGKVINDGLWHTVLVTYDGTTLLIYVDGILDNTITNWNSESSATVTSTLNTVGNSGNYLGQHVDGSSFRWIGQMKNVQFYDYVITNTYQLANSYQLAGSIIYNSGKYIYINIYIYLNYLYIYIYLNYLYI